MAGMEHFAKSLGKSHITADSLCSQLFKKYTHKISNDGDMI